MKIVVSPQSRLEETLRIHGALHMITLLSEGASFVRPAGMMAANNLHLTFHDIAQERPGLVPPSRSHVDQMLDFARRWSGQAPLLVHCYAGISRSTAAAYVLACALRPGRDEAELAQELRRQAPMATPNPLIVAHGDDALRRDGRMVSAIRRIGRGAEAFEGEPFCLDLG